MSLEQPDADVAWQTAHRHTLRRQEAVTTTTETLPAPARHGGNSTTVLEDIDRDVDRLQSIWDTDGRPFPDGSAYQFTRAAWLAVDDRVIHDGDEYVVLTPDLEHPHSAEDATVAATFVSSPWLAGTGTGDDYSAYYSYDLTLQSVADDGTIQFHRTPARSLTVKLAPQLKDLVYKNGSPFSIPFDEGTLVRVQVTWVDDVAETIKLATKQLGGLLGYELDVDDIAEGSATFTKAEVRHRFERGKEQHLVQTIRQSAELLAAHEADFDIRGKYADGKWLECWLQTDS